MVMMPRVVATVMAAETAGISMLGMGWDAPSRIRLRAYQPYLSRRS
jgi:hypothetical protein